jgi:hypothetical protein
MMGNQPGFQPKLFYHQINLEQRVPKDHLLRKIQEKIDFDFIYKEKRGRFYFLDTQPIQAAGGRKVPPALAHKAGLRVQRLEG